MLLGWRPFSQLSFAQSRGAGPRVRMVTSALLPSALGGQCSFPSAVPLGALNSKCRVSSAVVSKVHQTKDHRWITKQTGLFSKTKTYFR